MKNLWINQYVNQSVCHSINQSFNHATSPSMKQFMNVLVPQSAALTFIDSATKEVCRLFQSINQLDSESSQQTVGRSVIQAVRPSTNESIFHSLCASSPGLRFCDVYQFQKRSQNIPHCLQKCGPWSFFGQLHSQLRQPGQIKLHKYLWSAHVSYPFCFSKIRWGRWHWELLLE